MLIITIAYARGWKASHKNTDARALELPSLYLLEPPRTNVIYDNKQKKLVDTVMVATDRNAAA